MIRRITSKDASNGFDSYTKQGLLKRLAYRKKISTKEEAMAAPSPTENNMNLTFKARFHFRGLSYFMEKISSLCKSNKDQD